MRNDWRGGILLANPVDAARGEFDVDVTSALPQIHLAASPLHDPRAQILVGHKQDVSIFRRRAHDLVRVAARTNYIRLRFHPGAAIDVGNDVIILVRVLIEIRLQLFRRT